MDFISQRFSSYKLHCLNIGKQITLSLSHKVGPFVVNSREVEIIVGKMLKYLNLFKEMFGYIIYVILY